MDKSLIYDSTQYMFVAGTGAHTQPQLMFPPDWKSELKHLIARNQYPGHPQRNHSIHQAADSQVHVRKPLCRSSGEGGVDGKVQPL